MLLFFKKSKKVKKKHTKKHIRVRKRLPMPKPITKPKLKQKPISQRIDLKQTLSVATEQLEPMNTTQFCPQSLTVKELPFIKKNPELYIEINLITRSRMVDNFYISITHKSFTYKKKRYTISNDYIYLLPTKYGFFMPTSFYKENNLKAKSFEKTNKGITGKALSLLYNENLYADLFAGDDKKYNFFIVILSIIILILYSVGLYLLFFYEADVSIPLQRPSIPPSNLIWINIKSLFRGLIT